MIQDGIWVIQFVIGICDDNGIDGSGRKMRILGLSKNRPNVVLTFENGPDPQEVQWSTADLLRQHGPFWPDNRRKLQSEVSGTTTKIHNSIARSRIERVDDIGGTLPLVPLRFDSRQLLEGSNSLVRNHREAKNKEDGEKDERRTKRADNTLKHAATCFYGRRCG